MARSGLLFSVTLYGLVVSLPVVADPIAGDVDMSSAVNAVDVQLVINAALGASGVERADIDCSGATNAIDVQLVINAVLGLSIDSDSDGLCDGAEAFLGTRADLFDTDDDGIGDGQEVLDGTNPLSGSGLSVKIYADPATVAPNEPVVLMADVEGAGSEVTFDWDFGDGAQNSGNAGIFHTYASDGTYMVEVTVASGSQTASDTADVAVTSSFPQQSSTIGDTGGQVALGSCTVTVPSALNPQPVDFVLTELPSMAGPMARVLEPSRFAPIGKAYQLATPLRTREPFAVELTFDIAELPPGFAPENVGVVFRSLAVPVVFNDDAVGQDYALRANYLVGGATVNTKSGSVQFKGFHQGTFQVVAISQALVTDEFQVEEAPAKEGGFEKAAFPVTVVFQDAPEESTAFGQAAKDGFVIAFATLINAMMFKPPLGDYEIVVADPGSTTLDGWVNVDKPLSIFISCNLTDPDLIKKTVAHEFFHLIQLYSTNRVSYLAKLDSNGWVIEGTACWAMDEVFDSVADHYHSTTWKRMAEPLNKPGRGEHAYQAVGFWKWAEATGSNPIRDLFAYQRAATHTNVPGFPTWIIENSSMVDYQDSLLAVWPGVDYVSFAEAMVYWKHFDANETLVGDMWSPTPFLGAQNVVYTEPGDILTIQSGQAGDSETNKASMTIRLKQYLSADTLVIRNPGISGILHVKLPKTAAGKSFAATLIVHDDSTENSITMVDDMSQQEHHLKVSVRPGDEAVLVVVDPRWQQSTSPVVNTETIEVWVEDPCGSSLPGVVFDVNTTEQLVTALMTSGAGNTVRLAAGSYTLPMQLWPTPWPSTAGEIQANLVLDDATLVGAGRGDTHLYIKHQGSTDARVFIYRDAAMRNLSLHNQDTFWGQGVFVYGNLALCDVEVTHGSPEGMAVMFSPRPEDPGSYRMTVRNCVFTGQPLASGIGAWSSSSSLYLEIKDTVVTNWVWGVTIGQGVTFDIDCTGFYGNVEHNVWALGVEQCPNP